MNPLTTLVHAPVVASAAGGHLIPPIAWIAPFVTLLLCIAILPLAAPHFWHKNSSKALVSVALAIPVAIYYLMHGSGMELGHALIEYISFIALLGSLYIISGGIRLTGDLQATPRVNTTFLAIGAVLANFLGTTGAAMLLIRPMLQTNQEREHKTHIVVFFIFLVANVGGCLTPLGDPPLFLGYLRGVPFTWTLSLWPEWLLAVAILLTAFYFWDRRAYAQETRAAIALDRTQIRPLRLTGKINFLFLLGVILSILFLGEPWRELAMIAMAGLSLAVTPRGIRKENHFDFEAIIEVAVLFVGIFVTMVPALSLLKANGAALGIDTPAKFFWATGTLSGFLDNAPTYLAFGSLAQGLTGIESFADLAAQAPHLLQAISLGAVFMGAMTYIGNGPNFMVRAIAAAPGPYSVKMPEFFGYMLWSFALLVPTFLIITVLFFL
jgi:Na+/H+ antiporter NhaD/arsenite permease-like protein